ncbi:MAG: molybdenum cofactor guanylyltransferase MobA [Gammaproteobacteria bacterium]
MDSLVSGLVLAGGRGERLGGQDKGLLSVATRPMISLVLERFASQVSQVAISANRHLKAYESFGFPVLADESKNFDGPLAGIKAGLDWCPTSLLAVTPCDSPLLPPDLVARLYNSLVSENADIAMAVADNKRQPVFALLKTSVLGSLNKFLDQGERKIGKWYETQRLVPVTFDDSTAFININTEQDRKKLETMLL